MAVPNIQAAFVAGELSPGLWGRVDFARYNLGLSTCRNFYVNYRGGAYSRAGTSFVGFSKQSESARHASGSLAFSGNPTNGQTITLNGVVFTFVNDNSGWPTVTNSYKINIAGNLGGTMAFLADALAGALTTGTTYLADTALNVATYTEDSSHLYITYGASGVVGNAYTLAASAATASGAHLTGGTGGRSLPPRLITFQFNLNQGLVLEFGHQYMRVISQGAFVTETPAVAITGATQASPCVITATLPFVASGDWVYISNVGGMTELNGRTFVITKIDATHFSLQDVFGNNIDSTGYGAYTSGGTAARILVVGTPYSDIDLKFLKVTQSADVMSICCVNQSASPQTEYPPYELQRFTDENWILQPLNTASSIDAPANTTATATTTTVTSPTDYQYVVTAVDASTGNESVASNIGDAPDSVNIFATAGSINIGWGPVTGAGYYNIYKALPAYSSTVPVGSLFGFAGTAFGTSFVDTNIIQDMTQVPPLHRNPFARGQILSVTVTAGSTSLTACTAAITTSTGSGAVLTCVLSGGVLVAVIVENPGENYALSDTVTFTPTGGAAPTGDLVLGPQSGTYPSCVTYFQQRRVYANTQNDPDTYFMSQPGAFSNFDTRVPTIDTDAIIGTPWSVQVDGIQFMIPILGGLVALTGQTAYLVMGQGGSPQSPAPITPSSQEALPQVYNGCHFFVAPVQIDYDIYYLQSKGSIIRDLSYNFWLNLLTGMDVTYLSSQLFFGYDIEAMSYCEEPFKILWAVRNDGILLSLTTLKSQDVMGWARHDTQGLFESCTSVTEPPVDALYLATQRYYPNGQNAFMIERMNNRYWSDIEEAWCIDAGLALTQPEPTATLTCSSAAGLGQPVSAANLVGGTNYSPGTTVTIIDPTGTGCTVTPTITSGVITALGFSGGSGYTNPAFSISDPQGAMGGSGFSATVVLDNSSLFAASAAVFNSGMVGWAIRAGGGKAVITAYIDTTHVTAAIVSPITRLIPNTGGLPQGFASGDWTLTEPITTVTGLDHLAGMTVTGLADGITITPRVVSASGTITLDHAASAITVGLGFDAQMQSLYLDGGSQVTIQGRRKKIAAVTARVEASASFLIGANQPDGSAQSPIQVETTWSGMTAASTSTTGLAQPPYGSANIQGTNNIRAVPLYTGDVRMPLVDDYVKPGQAAVQQTAPLPCQVLDFVRESVEGDDPEQDPKSKRERRAA